MKKHTTKRALLASVFSLALCLVMLLGTTFAWFTDTASTAVNKIVSGKLDVDIVDKGGNSLDGKTLSFKNVDGSTDILWEPGATFNLDSFRIVNKGTLALKYRLIINGFSGDAKLLEAIDFQVKIGDNAPVALSDLQGALLPDGAAKKLDSEAIGSTDLITISGTMKPAAGNEYQGLTLDGLGITVVATQYTYESDSENDQYDALADATIQVNPDNIQDYLDGKYGSVNGMTLVLAQGDYGQLELGRATKYAGSHTRYFICEGNNVKNLKEYSLDAFNAIKNSGSYSYISMYDRSMDNVTFKAADGAQVRVAGVYASSGHKHDNTYDYVLDREVVNGNNGYFLVNHLTNLTFDGITFTAKSDINSSLEQTTINGITFQNCIFDINNTASGNQAIHYYNENNDGHVSNLVVKNCAFNTCYQGVYTNHVYGITVDQCRFNTTGHNAIAIQDFNGAGNHGQVVITNNTFANIGDRVIRFNNVGTDTQITIKNNSATASGDAAGEVIKATSLATGITYDIAENSWGEGAKVVNDQLKDR